MFYFPTTVCPRVFYFPYTMSVFVADLNNHFLVNVFLYFKIIILKTQLVMFLRRFRVLCGKDSCCDAKHFCKWLHWRLLPYISFSSVIAATFLVKVWVKNQFCIFATSILPVQTWAKIIYLSAESKMQYIPRQQ